MRAWNCWRDPESTEFKLCSESFSTSSVIEVNDISFGYDNGPELSRTHRSVLPWIHVSRLWVRTESVSPL